MNGIPPPSPISAFPPGQAGTSKSSMRASAPCPAYLLWYIIVFFHNNDVCNVQCSCTVYCFKLTSLSGSLRNRQLGLDQGWEADTYTENDSRGATLGASWRYRRPSDLIGASTLGRSGSTTSSCKSKTQLFMATACLRFKRTEFCSIAHTRFMLFFLFIGEQWSRYAR